MDGRNTGLMMQDKVENLVFWMGELLRLARELQKDLKRFYEPIKGWPPHIEALEGDTDFDAVLKSSNQFLIELRKPPGGYDTPSQNLRDALKEIKAAIEDFEATIEGEWSSENASIYASMNSVKIHVDIALGQLRD